MTDNAHLTIGQTGLSIVESCSATGTQTAVAITADIERAFRDGVVPVLRLKAKLWKTTWIRENITKSKCFKV
jgi:hypothetical protein